MVRVDSRLFGAICLLCVAIPAAAQSERVGDPASGADKAAMCAACHGADGLSPNPQFPNLRGQKDVYIAKQMRAFRDNLRVDPSMTATAAALSDADIDDLAAYFHALAEEPAQPVATAAVLPDESPVGDSVRGKERAQVCASCHGTQGVSLQPNYPNLSGQHRAYLLKQMTEFRGETRNDPIMTPMLKVMSEQDLVDIATFYAEQPVESAQTVRAGR